MFLLIHHFFLSPPILLLIVVTRQDGATALMVAAVRDRIKVVKLLADMGAQLNVADKVGVG